ncbi:MAG: bifunctional cytidylyltransferase/SDR family oxidoreductase [bacterium]|nr:bifunctional cytidylyltransferase/SDR family oxidoreductase [bacterium]
MEDQQRSDDLKVPVVAVVLAAGSGVRLRSSTPKQLMKLAGKPVLAHTLRAFEDVPGVDEIIVVTREDLVEASRDIIAREGTAKVSRVLIGGASRNDSTRTALNALSTLDEAKVLIHDAVRPFIERSTIEETIRCLDEVDAVDVAIVPADTIIEVEGDHITAMPRRSQLRRGQTPQAFKLSVLRDAYAHAANDPDFSATDDCGVVHRYRPDVSIRVVDGSPTNIKLTHPIDIYVADKLFQVQTLETEQVELSELKTQLNGHHIVVIGGSYGIGSEIGDLAEELGAHVHRFSRSTTGTHVEDGASVRAAIESVVATTGAIHHVVNSAGVLRIKPLVLQSDDEIRALMDVNYLGPINVARAAYPHLEATRGQLLFFTSSSFTRGRSHYALYTSSKAAVVNLTQALAEEWADAGVRVNCMNPERTQTPMRVEAFGTEDPESLLGADKVARKALETLVSHATGQVIDVRR